MEEWEVVAVAEADSGVVVALAKWAVGERLPGELAVLVVI